MNFIPGMEGKIEGLADRIGNLRNAISILWSGDFNGSYGTWEESDAIVDKLFDVREAMQDTYEYWRNLSWEDVKFSAKTIGDAFKDVDFGSIEDIKKATATVMDSLTRFSYDDTLNALDNFQASLEEKYNKIKDACRKLKKEAKDYYRSDGGIRLREVVQLSVGAGVMVIIVLICAL